jgi:hypothetical protein
MVINGRQIVGGQTIRPLIQRTVVPSPPRVRPEQLVAALQHASRPQVTHDPHTMSEVAVLLDKKEVLVLQLRTMNDEVAGGVHADSAGVQSQAFLQAYAQVVLQLKEVNERVEAKLLEMEQGGLGGEELANYRASAADGGGNLPPELMQGPISPQLLAEAALKESREVVANCRRKLVDAVTEAGGNEHLGPKAADRLSRDGKLLEEVIEGAVWSLVMLQQGSDKMVPMATLATALESSLLAVKPHADENKGLFAEIQEAMRNLRLLFLAV